MDTSLWFLADLDEKFAWPMRKRTHGVDPVHDQVDQDLLQLHRVSAHAGQISGKIGPQGNAVPGHLIATQNGDLLNNLINIHCNSIGTALLQEWAASSNHGARPGAVIDTFRA